MKPSNKKIEELASEVKRILPNMGIILISVPFGAKVDVDDANFITNLIPSQASDVLRKVADRNDAEFIKQNKQNKKIN